eukprot:193111-Chlamydomonas_euryale.AAC.10
MCMLVCSTASIGNYACMIPQAAQPAHQVLQYWPKIKPQQDRDLSRANSTAILRLQHFCNERMSDHLTALHTLLAKSIHAGNGYLTDMNLLAIKCPTHCDCAPLQACAAAVLGQLFCSAAQPQQQHGPPMRPLPIFTSHRRRAALSLPRPCTDRTRHVSTRQRLLAGRYSGQELADSLAMLRIACHNRGAL